MEMGESTHLGLVNGIWCFEIDLRPEVCTLVHANSGTTCSLFRTGGIPCKLYSLSSFLEIGLGDTNFITLPSLGMADESLGGVHVCTLNTL